MLEQRICLTLPLLCQPQPLLMPLPLKRLLISACIKQRLARLAAAAATRCLDLFTALKCVQVIILPARQRDIQQQTQQSAS
jgi:hypothetical protein